MPSPKTPRVLITGGSGFVGATIVQLLHRVHPGWIITVLDIKPRAAGKWGPEIPNADENIDFIEASVTDFEAVKRAIEQARPTVFVHTAGLVPGGLDRYSQKNREGVFRVNVEGTRNVLAAAKELGVKCFVYTGSCTSITDDLDHEYPNFNESVPFPDKSLVYGESKAAAESLVLVANSPPDFYSCSLRPSTIMGREDYQLVPAIQACIAKHETYFVIGSGDNLYDFTFVDNVAHSHVLAIENLLWHAHPEHRSEILEPPLRQSYFKASKDLVQQENGGRPYSRSCAAGHAILISNDQPITFRDFMLAIWAQFDHVPRLSVSIPPYLAWFVGLVAELMNWRQRYPTTLCRGSVADALGTRYASQQNAHELLGYQPIVDMWDGVRISCDALKERLERQAGNLRTANGLVHRKVE